MSHNGTKFDVGQEATLIFEPSDRTDSAVISVGGDIEAWLGSESIWPGNGIPLQRGCPFPLRGPALEQHWYAVAHAPTTVSVFRIPEAFEEDES